ncbi:MAG: branched-chain amino acid ABC transporter permease [Elsteraceae bacterium]
MKKILAAVAGVALLALPFLTDSDYLLNFAIGTLLLAYLGQSWNILGGYGGQFSFGHALFFGTGAYATAVLQTKVGLNPYLTLPFALAAGAAVGALVGALSFRYGLKGSYFALVTLAFAEVFRILASAVPFTGGGAGLLIPLDIRPENFQFASKNSFYFIALGLVAMSLAIAAWIERTRFGARLIALRENESSASALGVPVFKVKLQAIALSGAMAALGGSFYAQYYLYLDPSIAYGAGMSVEILLTAIVGGVGTIFGPLVGAFALHGVGEAAKVVTGGAPGLNLALYGLILILIVRLMPQGLMGWIGGRK